MKTLPFFTIIVIALLSISCASKYTPISPEKLQYISSHKDNGVTLRYKYDLLDKKYRKKESKHGVKLVALEITNNSDKDIVFGRDFTLTFENGNEVIMNDVESTLKEIKQPVGIYVLYLLLTPMQFNVTESHNGYITESSSTPIGLVIGPGIAGGNILYASSANRKLKDNLEKYNIIGETIKKGETKSALLGIKSSTYEALKLKFLSE